MLLGCPMMGRGDLGVREGADPRTFTWVRGNGINLPREGSRGTDLGGEDSKVHCID